MDKHNILSTGTVSQALKSTIYLKYNTMFTRCLSSEMHIGQAILKQIIERVFSYLILIESRLS